MWCRRNSVAFQDIIRIFNGEIITKGISNRFYKNLKGLNITIKDAIVTIDNNCYKTRDGNIYLPLHVNTKDNNITIFINKCVNKIINRINKIKEFFKFN